jgi:Protein of unknown function (DUF3313)
MSFGLPICRMKPAAAVIAIIFAAGSLASCSSDGSKQELGNLRASGFLSDYSKLGPGGEGEAVAQYWRKDADYSRYTKIMIDPVTVWTLHDSNLASLPAVEAQELVNRFHKELIDAFGEDFEIVDYPSADTLRLRVALTDAQASNTTMDTISTYVPHARLLSSVLSMGSDTTAFVGSATVEADLQDAYTGELLAAGVDRRAGTKAIGKDTFDSWGDVQKAFEAWALQARANLRKRRGS